MKQWFKRLERRKVVIVTKQDESYRGYVADGDRHSVVLGQVEFLPREGEPQPIVGGMLFLRENVACVQIPDWAVS